MKHILLIVALATSIAGCKYQAVYVQLWQTEAVNSVKTDNYYTYQNDTIRIDYVFWADKGVMAFRILNKSDKPIYIDWFKSSYISNALRYQYWNDKTKTEINFKAISIPNIGFQPIAGYTMVGSAVATKSKPERITFIPPKSYIVKTGYYLTNQHYTDWSTGYTRKEEPRNDRPKITTTIFTKQFTKENSPLDFRNFLTVSFKEDFSTEFYIDNEFYVKAIMSIDKNHFWDDLPNPQDANKYGDYRDFQTHFYSNTRYKKATDFYIKAY